MSVFVTTYQILNECWNDEPVNLSRISRTQLPAQHDWDHNEELDLENVTTWEKIYSQPGNVSVYAAWDPFAEFYVIVHELFLKHKEGIEKFYGIDAQKLLLLRCKQLRIELPINQIWVPDNSYQINTDLAKF